MYIDELYSCSSYYSESYKYTHIVQCRTTLTESDDLDRTSSAVGRGQPRGKRNAGHAEGAVARLVPERWCEGVVEVGRVIAQAYVDEDIGPRVVQVQDQAAALDGPVGAVARAGVDATACEVGVSDRDRSRTNGDAAYKDKATASSWCWTRAYRRAMRDR